MATRITVAPHADTAKADGILSALRDRFPKVKLTGVAVTSSYTVDAALGAKELEQVAKQLTHPTIETYAVGKVLAPAKFSQAIEIGFLPGVTDNVGNSATEMAADALGKKWKDGRIYSSYFIFLSGTISATDAKRITLELHNPLIESATVYPSSAFKGGKIAAKVPNVSLHGKANVDEVNLDVPEDELVRLGKEGVKNADGSRRGPLALSLPELEAIKAYFKTKGRQPTDIEIESLAQTWSEHCQHTIFNDPLDEIEEGLYKHYIRAATKKIREEKGEKDFCASVFVDNSGAIIFDDEYLVTHKVETHNSPSALDPFGGAITGIVGVNRDALGFGMGAKPIANVYGFCVGSPSDKREFFRDKEMKQPLLPARRILEGVVKGINAGGNQSGIPTPLGFVTVDPRYRGKPLVFAGTVGLIPRKVNGKDSTKKAARAGDLIVMMGGRVGLDGIHGATFSSEALSTGSPATAVQIGDPITQKKMSDAIVREARDKELYTSITDDGAGGLSCSVAEMARECGGAEVDLEKVPVKYPGLAPWQIWISESQERMTLAVPPGKWKELEALMKKRGVEATIIGIFTNSGSCRVLYKGKKLMDLELEFLHGGRPRKLQKSMQPTYVSEDPPMRVRTTPEATLSLLLSRPNVGSYAFISEQYDHEVQGLSITKPLQGKGRVNTDAAVMRPRRDSKKGLVLSQGLHPAYADLDSYAAAAAALDTAVRSAVAAGGTLSHLAILDNICWSSANTPERLYELKEAARACYEGAVAYCTPFISGKDSMFNDFKGFDAKGKPVHIAAPPTLLISAIGVMPDATNAVTVDAKIPGDLVYLVGETNEEFGGSEYAALLSEKYGKEWKGKRVPQTDFKTNLKVYRALEKAIERGIVSAAIPLNRGGLGVAAAKMAIAGDLGLDLSLAGIPGDAQEDDAILFSESQGRVLVTITTSDMISFEKLFASLPYRRLGNVVEEKALTIREGNKKFSIPVAKLAAAYRKPFAEFNP